MNICQNRKILILEDNEVRELSEIVVNVKYCTNNISSGTQRKGMNVTSHETTSAIFRCTRFSVASYSRRVIFTVRNGCINSSPIIINKTQCHEQLSYLY